MHRNTGARKPSGGRRIGRSRSFDDVPTPGALATARFSSRDSSIFKLTVPRGSMLSAIDFGVVPRASGTVSSDFGPRESGMIRDSVGSVESLAIAEVGARFTDSRAPDNSGRGSSRSDGTGAVERSRWESGRGTGRSAALKHVDQEEEFASTVELLVEASSSRELCVATVTFLPSVRPGS